MVWSAPTSGRTWCSPRLTRSERPLRPHVPREVAPAGDPIFGQFAREAGAPAALTGWQMFAHRHAEAKPSNRARQRWQWTEDGELAAAIWRRFSQSRPDDIGEVNLRDPVLALPLSERQKAAALTTLAFSNLE